MKSWPASWQRQTCQTYLAGKRNMGTACRFRQDSTTNKTQDKPSYRRWTRAAWYSHSNMISQIYSWAMDLTIDHNQVLVSDKCQDVQFTSRSSTSDHEKSTMKAMSMITLRLPLTKRDRQTCLATFRLSSRAIRQVLSTTALITTLSIFPTKHLVHLLNSPKQLHCRSMIESLPCCP